jgi:hypothetical protein
VIVKGYVPGATLRLLETVSVDVPDAVMLGGLNFPFANFGRPLTVKSTVPAKPVAGAIVTV